MPGHRTACVATQSIEIEDTEILNGNCIFQTEKFCEQHAIKFKSKIKKNKLFHICRYLNEYEENKNLMQLCNINSL